MRYKKELKRYLQRLLEVIESEQLIIEDCKLCIKDLDLQQDMSDWNIHDSITYRHVEILELRKLINYEQMETAEYRIRAEKKTIRKIKKQLRKLKEDK